MSLFSWCRLYTWYDLINAADLSGWLSFLQRKVRYDPLNWWKYLILHDDDTPNKKKPINTSWKTKWKANRKTVAGRPLPTEITSSCSYCIYKFWTYNMQTVTYLSVWRTDQLLRLTLTSLCTECQVQEYQMQTMVCPISQKMALYVKAGDLRFGRLYKEKFICLQKNFSQKSWTCFS